MKLAMAVLMLGILLAACAGNDTIVSQEKTTQTRGGITAPGQTPVPCDENGIHEAWTTTDLLVADALTACSAYEDGTYPRGFNEIITDLYAGYIQHLMASTLPTGASSLPMRWAEMRRDPALNCDPVSGKNGVEDPSVDASIVPSPVRERVLRVSHVQDRANGTLRKAGINLCVAQRLRAISPGASGGESLLLSESDQRQLLETTRERAQIAMLQYAALGVVFSTHYPYSPNPPPGDPIWEDIQEIQWWSMTDGGKELELAAMGRDFAAAVQLHVVVSEELSSLLARSRSANVARGGTTPTASDESWGPGSWHQRLLAAMYGGDPLAVDQNGPWVRPEPDPEYPQFQHWDLLSTPEASGQVNGWGWPERERMPYIGTDISEPQVALLLQLARTNDRLVLYLNGQGADCRAINVDGSGTDLYAWVEAELRLAECYGVSPGNPCPTEATKPAGSVPKDEYLLWRRYHITPEHALTLAKYLADNLEYLRSLPTQYPTCTPPNADPPYENGNVLDTRIGGQYFSGRVIIEDRPGGGKWLRFKDNPQFRPKPLQDVAPTFTRNAVVRFPDPWELAPLVSGFKQGLGGIDPANDEAKRLMGAIPALAATRHMLMGCLGFLLDKTKWERHRLDSYFMTAPETIRVIGGAIGDDSVVFRPAVHQDGSDLVVDTDQPYPPTAVYAHWKVDVTFSEEDAEFWAESPNVLHGVFAVPHPLAGNLASYPDSDFLGTNIQQLVVAAYNGGAYGLGQEWPQESQLDQLYPGTPRRWSAWNVRLPFRRLVSGAYRDSDVASLVAVRVDLGTNAFDYRLLGSNFFLHSGGGVHQELNAMHGQYAAYGGTLGGFVARQVEVREQNPSRHAFDGFGLPENWVPPFNAELVGGVSGQSSAERYLALARESAVQATGAVKSAMETLLAEQADKSALAAATAKSQAGIQEEKERLCGTANPECEFQVLMMPPSADWYPSLEDPNSMVESGDVDLVAAKKSLNATTDQVARGILRTNVQVAEPVLARIHDASVPAFSEFSGGDLQSAFIEQWRAIKSPDERIALLWATNRAAKASMETAHAVMISAQEKVKLHCSNKAMADARLAGISVSCGIPLGCSVSFSPGPLIAQQQRCHEATIDAGPAIAGAIEARASAFLALSSASVGVTDAQAAIADSGAMIGRLANETRLATSRLELEQKLAAVDQRTSFGLYRRYTSYDLWRAKALVERSRRYALTARRAVEARYVVDLSAMSKPEAFVQAPSTWADEIYGYDLSLPAAVGLAVGEEASNGIYPNKVEDYVSNIEGFVTGFAVERPSAVSSNEIDVVDLRGTALGEPVVEPESGEAVYPDQGAWTVRCEGGAGDVWKSIPAGVAASQACCYGDEVPLPDSPSDNVCDSRPTRVRTGFVLDPWGRVNDHITNEPFERRYNGRWTSLAVNLVGTAVKDCTKAPDPFSCYSSGFVRFDLTHLGPAWIADYDGIWRSLNLPTGRIEGGKGLAAELWLDPLEHGWTTDFIAAVARTEFELRPLGGSYDLEIVVTPEVDLDQIERVQILVGSTCWVRQD